MLYFLLAAIGVVLLLPTGTKKTSEETEQPQETAARPAGDAGLSVQEEMEQRLCDALSQMDGVGAVHVVVTLESTGSPPNSQYFLHLPVSISEMNLSIGNTCGGHTALPKAFSLSALPSVLSVIRGTPTGSRSHNLNPSIASGTPLTIPPNRD